MVQGGILHQNRGRGILHSRDAIAHINSTILHTKATAVQIRHGIHHRCAGIENFFRRGRAAQTVRRQQLVEVLFCVLAGKDNIPRLLVNQTVSIRVISIQIHRAARNNVHRIPELNTLPRRGGQRNHIPAASCINTAQTVSLVSLLCILLEQDGIVVPDIQITVAANRTAGVGSPVPAERHTLVVGQRYRAVAIPINRAAGVGSPVPAERHALVPAQSYRAVASPINRAAFVGSRVPDEGYASVVA